MEGLPPSVVVPRGAGSTAPPGDSKAGDTFYCCAAGTSSTSTSALVTAMVADPTCGTANVNKLHVIETGTITLFWPERSIVPDSVGSVSNRPRSAATPSTTQLTPPAALPTRATAPVPVWV